MGLNNEEDLWYEITQLAIEDPRYNREAYLFVLNSLNWAFQRLGRRRHLSGQEFTEFLVAYAQEEFGDLADCVLQEWGVMRTRDFGEIVYNLIEAGKMSKEHDDSIDDFNEVLNLKAALNDPDFVPRLLT